MNSFGQALTEGFEGATFPPTGWTIDTQVASRPWIATNNSTFLIAGTKSAAIAWIVDPNDANLISPSFSLAGYSAATFSFQAKVGYEYMVAPFPNGDLFAKISIDGGTSWTTLWVEEDYGTFADYETLDVSLDLTDYLGQANVQIKFEYTGTDADTVSVDTVLVDGTLSTNDFVSGKFNVYPNPVNGNLVTISNNANIQVNKVAITDVNGRTVKTVNFDGVAEARVNVGDLNTGVYFMNIDTNEGTATKKIVKN